MDDSFVWKTDRPWPNHRLKRAAIIGHTTPTSTRIWLRTGTPGDFTLLLFPSTMPRADAVCESFKKVPFQRLSTLPDAVQQIRFNIADYASDTIAVVDLAGLEVDTEYTYALYGQDGDQGRILLGQDRRMCFSTAPPSCNSISFGFYSCHMPYEKSLFGKTKLSNVDMWECFEAVLEHKRQQDLQFVIAGGDQVYADGIETLSIWRFLNKVARKKRGELLPHVDSMVSWYRDIYRGYWGFQALQRVLSRYPTYMIWDDHELADGWGSHKLTASNSELDEILPDLKKRKLNTRDGLELINRMGQAAKQVYNEYQHSHNPTTDTGVFDYSISKGPSAYYVLDGRGHRDIEARSPRILGRKQMNRFAQWIENQDPNETPFLFIVSAVPVVHLCTVIANADDNVLSDIADMQDDLRDSWEHKLHNSERRKLLKHLFAAAAKGFRICILSGDVHVSAAFRLTDKETGKCLYQLTSSAITYNTSRALAWLLGKAVADEGESPDGYQFRRLALYTDSNFSIIKADAEKDEVLFELYGEQKISDPNDAGAEMPLQHAIAKLELRF